MAIDTTIPRTRRAVLMGALGGAVAAVAAALGRAGSVTAADGDIVKVGNTYTATSLTEIDATGANGFSASSDSSTGVNGASVSGNGVIGESYSGIGVYGFTRSTSRPSLQGWSVGNSTGVLGYSSDGSTSVPATPANTGVYGRADSAHGTGVLGQTIDTTAETYGVHGLVAASLGTGVLGSSGSHAFLPPTPRANTGVMDVANGRASIGVYGKATGGRGAVLAGGKAQLQLLASTATTHPATGALGDLFLDRTGRLWLFKGSTVWVRLG